MARERLFVHGVIRKTILFQEMEILMSEEDRGKYWKGMP
jgi:hypothetical protein